jgi:teichoic acid transport system permease protein
MTEIDDPGVADYSDVEYVFEPHSRSLPNIREYVAAIWDRRRFIVELARSDIRTARSRTALGNIWNVLDPLFQAAIYFFLYTVLRKGASSKNSFLPVLIGGIYLFALTMNALNEGGSSIKRQRGLMLNSTFPRALLPVTNLYKNLKQFIPSACVFLVLFPLVGGRFSAAFLMLPILFALQTVMNLGISLLVATFVTLVADGQNVMSYVSRILFFATPVVYPVTLLPSGARALIGWQPLFPLFASYQAVFSGAMPSTVYLIETTAWAVALLVIGSQLFLRHEREFAMHL